MLEIITPAGFSELITNYNRRDKKKVHEICKGDCKMKRVAKAIALGLCVTTASYTLGASAPAFAAENAVEETKQNDTPSAIESHVYNPEKSVMIPEGNAYVPKGVTLSVILARDVGSDDLHMGDVVPLYLMENLIINDVVVVEKGTYVNAYVTKVKKAGHFGRSGKLEFVIKSVKSINNVDIPLEYVAGTKTSSDGGAVAVAAVVSVIGGFFMKGKNVHFKAGQQFDCVVPENVDLKVKKEHLAEEMDPNKPQGVSVKI